MASSCKLRRDNPSVLIKIRDLNKKSTECLCLLCFYFCAADKEFQNDFAKQSLTKTAVHDKELVSSTLQNCTCSKAGRHTLIQHTRTYLSKRWGSSRE
jgi:hypothetical protein